MRYIIFDIDGTLSIVGDRVKCLEEKDWDTFYERCAEDLPNLPIIDICSAYLALGDSCVIFLTGRRESVRQKTMDWLQEYLPDHEINNRQLLMRPDGDFRHDTIVKPEILQQKGIKPFLVFEDRASMVRFWRDSGVTCVQVADGEF